VPSVNGVKNRAIFGGRNEGETGLQGGKRNDRRRSAGLCPERALLEKLSEPLEEKAEHRDAPLAGKMLLLRAQHQGAKCTQRRVSLGALMPNQIDHRADRT